MVYCGKPSKGCSACRERKVRCDQREPACGQCYKRQQQCPGYRNMVDLMFRDESKHVINKVASNRTSKNGGVKKLARVETKTKGSASVTRSISSSPDDNPLDSDDSINIAFGVSNPSSILDSINDLAPTYNSHRGPVWASSKSEQFDDTLQTTNRNGNVIFGANDRLHINYPISHSTRERGTAFFFSRYVAVDFGCYQNFDFIYEVWRPPSPEANQVDCVTASMAAVGLAGLSKITGSSEMMIEACHSYGTALKLTNAALQDPGQAVQDSTMLSILILATYEFITGRTPQTMAAWQGHVNGAAAVTRMRGTAPFRTKAGTRMFLMLCHSVLISCIQGGIPMPQAMLDLRNDLGQYTNTSNTTWRIFEPICRAIQIRHDIKNGTLSNTDDIVARLTDVENEFVLVVNEMPRQWRYQCVQVQCPSVAILGNTCHIYPNFSQATTWNGMRTMRILVQETILEQLCSSIASTSRPDMRHQALLAKSVKLLEMLGQAIVASVPQHFGIVSSRDAMYHRGEFIPAASPPHRLPITTSPSPSLSSTNHNSTARHTTPDPQCSSPRPTLLDPTQSDDGRSDAERFLTLASASNTIIWPLYTLGMSSSCTRETRRYIIERLEAIHVETGLEQAASVKALVEGKIEASPWEGVPLRDLPTLPHGCLPDMV